MDSPIVRPTDQSALLRQIFDSNPIPMFVLDASHRVRFWNRACARLTGLPAERVLGTREHWIPFYGGERPTLADIVMHEDVPQALAQYYPEHHRASPFLPGGYEAEGFFPSIGRTGRWLLSVGIPLKDPEGRVLGALASIVDVTERREAQDALKESLGQLDLLVDERTKELIKAKLELEADIQARVRVEAEQAARIEEMARLNGLLQQAQDQLLQSEKMASVGVLAAGVAHEINNPIGYVQSNISRLQEYLRDLMEIVTGYEALEAAVPPGDARLAAVHSRKEKADLDFLKEDIPSLLGETLEGVGRVRKIVQDLRDFSRAEDSRDWQTADLHKGLESTINVATNEIKYKADVVREYGELPPVQCRPSQLNQVFMNLLVNAAQACGATRGRITVRTGCEGENAWIEVADTGCGIAPENLKRIFDPFFTTKPVGKGTGLGLAISYGIVQGHGGHIEVSSEVGRGTTFRVTLPVAQGGGAMP